MRLIDAQALLQEHCFCLSPNTKDYGSEWYKGSCDECLKDGGFCGLEVSGDVIWNAPTIDAEPIKHGRWKVDEKTGDLRCSVCGHYTCEIQYTWVEADEERANVLGIPVGTKYVESGSPKYCSGCGSRMDEVENG